MTLRLLISLNLLLLAALAARAQTAEEFFNGGAQFYISNNLASAWQKVETGRKLYPADEKLKKLEELLKQQSQQQQQQQNQQNQQSQPNQSNQPPQNQQSQPQNSSGQQNQSQQNQPSQNQPAPNQPDQQQNQQPQPAAGQKSEKSERPESQNQATPAREMSPEEARRLLDAQKGDEQILQFKPPEPPKSQNQPVKDW